MNSSFFTCDRSTHLKIVAVSLVAAIVVALAGLNARMSDGGTVATGARTNGAVVKAGKPSIYSTRDDWILR
jgi:hypothetical protein